jgi:SAM-dependent methyltransferase
MWGAGPGAFCSGNSSCDEAATAYLEKVRALIETEGVKTVVDLGCGDFQIGSRILDFVDRYIGCDIVPGLVAYNSEKFGSEKVEFQVLDIVNGPLPPADLCLVRQVFQHLSNAQIKSVLPKLRAYRIVLVTEHFPVASKMEKSNIDKVHGPDIRLYDRSAVVLSEPPFSLERVEELLSVPLELGEHKGEIKTFRIH